MSESGTKFVYSWGGGEADGHAEMKELLGGKGANLQEMARLGIPVPPGFTLSTDVWRSYEASGGTLSEAVLAQVDAAITRLESDMGGTFGGAEDPLLVSVRSGAAVSMPGMMDTVLNLGLNDGNVGGLVAASGNAVFAWDCYRRFVQMYGNVVLGIETHRDEVPDDVEGLRSLVHELKAEIADRAHETFPDDPRDQLLRSVQAVFRSWNTARAITYRNINGIPNDLGTACSVVAMVYGNRGPTSGTGVLFSRELSSGERRVNGNWLANAQGEDVVAGTHNTLMLDDMKGTFPDAHRQLLELSEKLERRYLDAQDIEFTIQDHRLFLLQTRSAKRTAQAAVRIAVEMVDEGLIDKQRALLIVSADQLEQLFRLQLDLSVPASQLAQSELGFGKGASVGAGVGQIVLDSAQAEARAAAGDAVVLVRPMTTPDDVGGMNAAQGILTVKGGTASHAALVARQLGKPCVIDCAVLEIDLEARTLTFTGTGTTVAEGDWITVDGSTGAVYAGQMPVIDPELTPQFHRLMAWADAERRLGVRANADTPGGAATARELGAAGIGLCRTEHMFFEPDRLAVMREMILTGDRPEAREAALAKVYPLQRDDFVDILRAMQGLPVTIRLLDPPLHEFLPEGEDEIEALAKTLGVDVDDIHATIASLHEENPMLGHRGCRLGITHPEVYDVQVRAIAAATATLRSEGVDALPEIMIPLVSEVRELSTLRARAERVLAQVSEETGTDLSDILIGTMIELPRACVTADRIAGFADFFSFGTNDLTQTTFGLSRDDTSSMLRQYGELGLLDHDPFGVLDEAGVGALVEMACEKGRAAKPGIKLGICGEHGGDPQSVAFCHRIGLDYVSCSPYRVPTARLAAAQAALADKG